MDISVSLMHNHTINECFLKRTIMKVLAKYNEVSTDSHSSSQPMNINNMFSTIMLSVLSIVRFYISKAVRSIV